MTILYNQGGPVPFPPLPAPCGARFVSPCFVGEVGPVRYELVQTAINASAAGETVFIFPGTYVEAITLKNGVDLIGSGPDTTILSFTGGASPTVTDGGVPVVSSIQSVRIQNTGASNVALNVTDPGSVLTLSNCLIESTDAVNFVDGATSVGLIDGTNSTTISSASGYALNINDGIVRNVRAELGATSPAGSFAIALSAAPGVAENCTAAGPIDTIATSTIRNCRSISSDATVPAIQNKGLAVECIGECNAAAQAGFLNTSGRAVNCKGFNTDAVAGGPGIVNAAYAEGCEGYSDLGNGIEASAGSVSVNCTGVAIGAGVFGIQASNCLLQGCTARSSNGDGVRVLADTVTILGGTIVTAGIGVSIAVLAVVTHIYNVTIQATTASIDADAALTNVFFAEVAGNTAPGANVVQAFVTSPDAQGNFFE